MVIVAELKEIRWQGDSRKVAHRFPKGARNALGKELTRVQIGLQPRDGKWLTDIGPGVQEIRIPIATPKEEIDLASKRYKELVRSLRRS